MYSHLKVGEEVSFPGLIDIRLIIEEVHENRGNVRCKYYDEHLKRYIRLTLPCNALVPISKGRQKLKAAGHGLKPSGHGLPPLIRSSILDPEPAGSFQQGPVDDIC